MMMVRVRASSNATDGVSCTYFFKNLFFFPL
jgi:hypothetical protein